MNANLAAIMTLVAAITLTPVLPAQAEDGVWKVGSSYVIHFQHLDLSRPADRAALLVQVEKSAAKLCEGLRPKTRRGSCTDAAIRESLGASPKQVRQAVQTARVERDGQRQAQR